LSCEEAGQLRAIVIGAGVVGAAVAAGLTRRGASVTVLEAAYPGAGTTGATFAWVNSANKEPEPYFALNYAGVRAHHALADGGASWFSPTGNLERATTDEHRDVLAARLARLSARNYPATRLTAAQARELEPDLVAPADAEYAFYPEEGHTQPLLLLARLLGEARDRGAVVHANAAVSEVDGGTVRTTAGSRYDADVVVSCAGRWTTGVAALAGAHVPMLDPDLADPVTAGFLFTTTPMPIRLSRKLTTSELNVRPDGGGRMLLHAIDLDGAADPAAPPVPDDALVRSVVHRLGDVLEGADAVAVERVQIGQRAIPADGRTVAGFTSDRHYVVATHSGVTLAPLLADLVAGEIFGAESPMLASFRPDRFATGTPYSAPLPARRPGEQ
jgi:glycine/D-amino acid oxidase-like deaminating enzyme